jgi:hypothetical protein
MSTVVSGLAVAGFTAGGAVAQTTVRAPLLTPDPTTVWTLQDENASITTANLSDKYYTNGFRVGFTSGTEAVPSALIGLQNVVLGEGGQHRYSIDLSQQIFNPADTTSGDPPPGDRPFAGLLLANFGLWQDTASSRGMLGLSLGLVGPDALGRQVQNGFHDIIGQNKVEGWNTQLPDQPVFELLSSRVWREPIGTVFGLETDGLLDASAGVGLVRIYGEGGGQLRIGQGLNSDFGVARVRPGPSGGDVFRPVQPFAWYMFAGVDGQVVGYDVTLNGTLWRDSRSVTPEPLVGEAEGGLAIMAYGVRLTYTQVVQTQEFKHQKGGPHQFGSLALSVRF